MDCTNVVPAPIVPTHFFSFTGSPSVVSTQPHATGHDVLLLPTTAASTARRSAGLAVLGLGPVVLQHNPVPSSPAVATSPAAQQAV
jgi:hypothetical protein